jgi:RNA polymerase sigma factor (sigma-70 family)
MKNAPARPAQPRSVAMNGHAYAWDATRGLDPAVTLEVMDFIRKKAWAHAAWASRTGLEVADLIQEGVAGALKAAARFDPEAGASYLTYAAWWIEAAMKEALFRPFIRTPDGAAFARVHSLDAPVREEEGPAREDWQRDDQPGPLDLAAAEEARARVRRALPALQPRDREVLARHLGLDGHPPQSLLAVARSLGVTRQRAAQLLDRARQDLRRELTRGRA